MSLCQKCGKLKDLRNVGNIYKEIDKFFPKWLCTNCVYEFQELLHIQEWYNDPSLDGGERDYDICWRKFFKKWFTNSLKEQVSFT